MPAMTHADSPIAEVEKMNPAQPPMPVSSTMNQVAAPAKNRLDFTLFFTLRLEREAELGHLGRHLGDGLGRDRDTHALRVLLDLAVVLDQALGVLLRRLLGLHLDRRTGLRA